MDECVEFNHRWLTEELGIDPDEITFIEDVWAGGGNLGPSIEYFVGGLELGNMVFMQYKTFPDGSREPLQVQVIDVGIGLERVPWLVNGSPTSYVDVFPSALKFMQSKINLDVHDDVSRHTKQTHGYAQMHLRRYSLPCLRALPLRRVRLSLPFSFVVLMIMIGLRNHY
jgi:alanyl-tRNA synthetase